jgi:hypothetical protein
MHILKSVNTASKISINKKESIMSKKETTEICPLCTDGITKSGRTCPACKGVVNITPKRYEEISTSMEKINQLNKKRGWYTGGRR